MVGVFHEALNVARTRFVGVKLDPEFYGWLERLSKIRKTSVSDTVRAALTHYREIMQLPGNAIFRSEGELNAELLQAYQLGAPIADLPNNNATSRSEEPSEGTRSARPSARRDRDTETQ